LTQSQRDLPATLPPVQSSNAAFAVAKPSVHRVSPHCELVQNSSVQFWCHVSACWKIENQQSMRE
jgi:hypothetical protein